MKSQRSFRIAFAGAFGIGTCTIIITSCLGAQLSWLSIALPVLIMLIYSAIVSQVSRCSEEAGDSLYYLGFSFTLIALMVAMAGVLFKNEVIEPKTVVKAFGIALSTTVVGLVGRILLFSYADEAPGEDIKDVLYDDALSGILELRREVGETVQHMADWRNEATEHWRDIRERETNGLLEALSSHQSLLSEQSSTFHSTMSEAYSGLDKYSEDALSNIRTAANEAIEQMKEVARTGIDEIGSAAAATSKEIKNAFGGASQYLDDEMESTRKSVQEATDSLHSTIKGFHESMERVQQDIRETHQAWVSEVETAVEAVGKNITQQLTDSSGTVIKASKSLAEELNKNVDIIEQTEEVAEKTQRLFTNLCKKLESAIETLSLDEIQSVLEGASKAIKEQEESGLEVSGKLEKVASNLSEVSEQIVSLSDSLKTIDSELQRENVGTRDLQEKLSDARQEIVKDVQSSHEALREVMDTLVQAMRKLREEIKKYGRR